MQTEILTKNYEAKKTEEYLDQPLPSNLEAEKTIIGAIFLDNRLMDYLSRNLKAAAFYSATHQKIYRAMSEIYQTNSTIDPIIVAEKLGKQTTEQLGGVSRLANFTFGLSHFTEKSIEQYVRVIKEKAAYRWIITQCGKLAKTATEQESSPAEIAAQMIEQLSVVVSKGEAGRVGMMKFGDAMPEQLERWQKLLDGNSVAIRTGIHAIDQHLTGNGFEKGMMHVIAARPGNGKTSIGLDIAGNAAADGKTVVFFTMELSREVLLDRFIAPFANIARGAISANQMNEGMMLHLHGTGEKLSNINLYIDDRARTVQEMDATCARVARMHGGEIDVVIADFIQNMSAPGKKNAYEATTHNARELPVLAKKYNAALLALSQLSRDIEKRSQTKTPEIDTENSNQKPKMSDFRDSGAIEEVGRTILVLWGSNGASPFRYVKCSCLKQGEGQTFDVNLCFNTDTMSFGGRESLYDRAAS